MAKTLKRHQMGNSLKREEDTSLSLHPTRAAANQARKHLQKLFSSEIGTQILTNLIFQREGLALEAKRSGHLFSNIRVKTWNYVLD